MWTEGGIEFVVAVECCTGSVVKKFTGRGSRKVKAEDDEVAGKEYLEWSAALSAILGVDRRLGRL